MLAGWLAGYRFMCRAMAKTMVRIDSNQIEFKGVDSYLVLKTKNNDGLHFCTTEIYIPQECFLMCNNRRELMF